MIPPPKVVKAYQRVKQWFKDYNQRVEDRVSRKPKTPKPNIKPPGQGRRNERE